MDRYIKMCSEFKELQKGWEPEVGDWICHKKDWNLKCLGLEGAILFRKNSQIKNLWIWLPTTDRLIAMLEGKNICWEILFRAGVFFN